MRYFDSCDLPIWHLVRTKLSSRLPKLGDLCCFDVIRMSLRCHFCVINYS